MGRRANASALALVTTFACACASAAPNNCSWWYETTKHGSAFRNVKDYGAIGDGVTDDTAALRAAINAGDTGTNGTSLAKSAAVVYFPAGVYNVHATIVVWFWTIIVGNPLPGCASTIELAPASSSFGNPRALQPVVAANGGFNSTATDEAWWRTDRGIGGHANDLFYASVRDIVIRVREGNDGAVALYWPVAQQTAIRNVDIVLISGAIGLDFAGLDYAVPFSPSIGGGGLVEGVRVRGGSLGMRLAGSQWSFVDISIANATTACVLSKSLIWTHTFVRLHAERCPVALSLSGAIGSVMILDSLLGPGLGPTAIETDATSGIFLQNVGVAGNTQFVIDAVLPAPASGSVIGVWARGPVYESGHRADVNRSGRALELPSSAAAIAAGLPLSCHTVQGGGSPSLCGGSREDPGTGIPMAPRPSFVGERVDNAVTDFGAVGDGIHDDTDALAAALRRPNSVTFLPFGTYAVRGGVLVLGCNASLVGEGLSAIALMANQSQVPSSSFIPLLATQGVTCRATVVDVCLTTLGTGNDGVVLLDHSAGPASGFYDVTMRIVYRVGLKARLGVEGEPGGAGILSNTWWW